jgi:hypothetical protein
MYGFSANWADGQAGCMRPSDPGGGADRSRNRNGCVKFPAQFGPGQCAYEDEEGRRRNLSLKMPNIGGEDRRCRWSLERLA